VRDTLREFCGVFRLLPGLTHVYLTKCRRLAVRVAGADFQALLTLKQLDVREIGAARNHIGKVLASNEEYLCGKAPEVEIREWQCLPSVSISI